MARRKSRRGGSANEAWKIFAASLLVTASLIVFGVLAWVSENTKVPVDQTTLCRTDQPPPAITVLLIDTTDALAPLETQQLANELSRLRDGMQTYSLIQIYSISGDTNEHASLKVSLCNPGRGSEMNPLYQNPKLAEERWAHVFNARIQAVFESVAADDASSTSPILETLRAVSVSPLGRPEFDSATKRIVLASDLLQHSELNSHYRREIDFEALRRSSRFAAISASLRNVEVEVLYITRKSTSPIQGREHLAFWEQYFTHAGADLTSVNRIHGE
jgi:hypothetical protein